MAGVGTVAAGCSTRGRVPPPPGRRAGAATVPRGPRRGRRGRPPRSPRPDERPARRRRCPTRARARASAASLSRRGRPVASAGRVWRRTSGAGTDEGRRREQQRARPWLGARAAPSPATDAPMAVDAQLGAGERPQAAEARGVGVAAQRPARTSSVTRVIGSTARALSGELTSADRRRPRAGGGEADEGADQRRARPARAEERPARRAGAGRCRRRWRARRTAPS